METIHVIDKVMIALGDTDNLVQSANSLTPSQCFLVLNCQFSYRSSSIRRFSTSLTGSPGSTTFRFLQPTDRLFKDYDNTQTLGLRLLNSRYPSAKLASGASIIELTCL